MSRHAAPRSRASGPGFADVLRVREFRGLWLAQVTSIVGDQLSRFALAYLIYRETDKNALLSALAFAVSYLPALVTGAFAGALVDVVPRRRVMLVCDLVRAALVAVMCLPSMPVAALLGIYFVVGGLASPFATARAALLPEILEGEAYPVGQGLGSVTEQVGQIVGLGAAGALVSILTPRGTLALDAATFVGSALLVVASVRARPASHVRTTRTSYWRLNAEGARTVVASPLLRSLLGVSVLGLGLLIATEGLAVAYASQIGGGSIATGILTAAVPTGSAIGLTLASRVVPPDRRLNAIRFLCSVWGLPLVATALEPPLPVAFGLWALAGGLSAYQLLANLIFARAVPDEVRGRAFSFAQTAIIAIQGIGLVVFGAIADVIDPSDAVALAGLVGLAGAPFFARALRKAPTRERRRARLRSSQAPQRRLSSMPAPSAHPARSAPPGDAVRPSSAPVEAPAARTRRSRLPWRAVAVYGIAAVVLVVALTIAVFGHVPDQSRHAPVHIPWWVLIAVFTVTEAFAVPFQRGRHATLVSLSQIPLILGMFLSSPPEVILSSTGGVLIFQIVHYVSARRVWVKIAANLASGALLATVAVTLFGYLRPSLGVSWASLGIAFLVATIADVVTLLFILAVRRVYAGFLPAREFFEPLVYGLPAGMAASSLGMLAVVAMHVGATYGLLLLVVGVLVIAGSRAYADLQQRHQGLGDLYSFAESLGSLVPRADSLWTVLRQTCEIMTASSVELALEVDPNGENVNGLQRVLTAHIDGRTRELWRAARTDGADGQNNDELSVQLTSSGHRLGTLTVRNRLGQIRGFRRADLQLLETLGGRVADALEKGLLLERLRDAATHDGLTGLLTLAELTSQLDEELVRGRPYVVVLVDVARLRDVNDSLGHEAGDALLRTVASRLTELAPPGAFLARSGGGEFAAAIPNPARVSASSIVERLADGLSGLVQVLGVTVDLRTRSGWLLCPEDADEAATALRRADLALGEAKRGVQRTARYVPGLEVDGMRRLRLVNELRDALEANELNVVYQPLVNPRSGVVIGAEALARWTHPELGPLPPDEFIIIAEQSGLIGKLTEQVLDKALSQARAWEEGGRSIRIAVNLSARCLSDLQIPGMVLDLLARHRVAPDRLTLEVTETSVAEDPEHAEVVLERLRNLGIRLSIDDFGTGYSSLAALKRFPVQEVKLDRQFLVDLEAGLENENPNSGHDATVDIALLTAIVTLGHSLGLEIVAEGIESPRAYVRLRDLGVDVLQGYLIGRPGPGDRLPESFAVDKEIAPPPRRRARV